MKKLLHLQLLPWLTGVQNFSLHLLDGLPPDEFEIHVASQPGGDLVSAVRQRGYSYIPLSLLRHPISLLDLFAFLQLIWVFRKHRFDIVHTNSSKPGLLGRIAATLCGVPLVIHTVHGTAFQAGQPPLVQFAYQALEWLGNRLCHQVVYVNDSDRLNCLRLGLVSASKAKTIHNAIPPELSRQLEEIAQKRKRKKRGDEFVIGSTLRFSCQKNVIALVSAACQACKAEPRLRFILLGEGEHLALCRQIVRSHQLNHRILLPGWDPRVADWLARFDAFILWSRWEAQPLSIIEAMFSGLPVIGSAIPSIAELVTDDCGWLIALDDTKALTECMISLARHSAAGAKKGIAARQRISALCSYNQMVSSYLGLYRQSGI